MPSVTDLQQQQSSKVSLSNNGKSTPPPPSQQQQQTNSASSGTTTDPSNLDPITQAILLLEKKQRNLGKRKEKLESYEQEAKNGKELNKDQKDALAKYAEVLGQIECVKDVYEQMKKLQTETAKSQKRLSKQAAEEKRLLVAQRLREYAQLRYLLDHRPASLKNEESSLLDELSRLIIPSDASLNIITRSVENVLAIYQGGPSSSTIKTLTGRTPAEVRQSLEQLIQQLQNNDTTTTPQQTQLIETVKQTPLVPQVPPTTPASVLPQREQQSENNNNDVMIPSLSHTHLVQTNSNEYPLQFDTRNPTIPFQEILQDNMFFPVDHTNNNQQDSSNKQENQSTDPKQFMQTFTGLNSTLTNQVPPQGYTHGQTAPSQQQQQGMNNYEQENSSNVVGSGHVSTDEQQPEEQWQQRRSNSGNANRSGHFNGSANRGYNRGAAGASNNYHQQQHWRGTRGGQHDNSYGGGQRQYNENTNRGAGNQRGGFNPNYRGNRGGSYRGGNRGGNAGYNDNGYQKSSQYQQNNDQPQQVRSAPPKPQQ